MGLYQTAELPDTTWVVRQLKSELRDILSTRNRGQLHSYGSAQAAERWSESNLAANTVRLAIETETLPVSVRVQTSVGVPVRCSLVSCSNGQATYAVAMEG